MSGHPASRAGPEERRQAILEAGLSVFAAAGFEAAKLDDVADKAGIAKGTIHPFTGPINKQDGSARLKAGEKASDKDLSSMNFYVEGVEGSLPK